MFERITGRKCPHGSCHCPRPAEPHRSGWRVWIRGHAPTGAAISAMVYYGIKVAAEVLELVSSGFGAIT